MNYPHHLPLKPPGQVSKDIHLEKRVARLCQRLAAAGCKRKRLWVVQFLTDCDAWIATLSGMFERPLPEVELYTAMAVVKQEAFDALSEAIDQDLPDRPLVEDYTDVLEATFGKL